MRDKDFKTEIVVIPLLSYSCCIYVYVSYDYEYPITFTHYHYSSFSYTPHTANNNCLDRIDDYIVPSHPTLLLACLG